MKQIKISERYGIGEVLGTDVCAMDGRLLIPKGVIITERIYDQIINWEHLGVLGSERRKPAASIEEQYYSLKPQRQEEILFQQSVQTVREVFLDMREGHGFNEEAVRSTAASIVDSIAKDEKIGLRLSRLWEADDYTFHHSVDVCLISTLIGLNLGLEEEEAESLATGAILHDLGKIQIPNHILNKTERLSNEEFALMKKHPEIGAEIIKMNQVKLPEEQMACILQHHEKCNGGGYPFRLKYPRLHLFSRIVAVADVYSALTTNRSYRARMDYYKAADILSSESKASLDKHIVFVLMDRLRGLMVNTKVRLSTGEYGFVVKFVDEFPLQPTVLVTENVNGQKVVSPYLLDLMENPKIFIQQVLDAKL